VEVTDRGGKSIAGAQNWLQVSRELLRAGKILAVKGLGGFHLACDGQNKFALKALRRRKGRKAKPFAVMCRDLETVRKYCLVGAEEARLLASPQAPVVILRRKLFCGLPEELAPGQKTLGVMLPYTPLHLLLLSGSLEILVMTSGNYRGLPLVKDNARAAVELGGIAGGEKIDLFWEDINTVFLDLLAMREGYHNYLPDPGNN